MARGDKRRPSGGARIRGETANFVMMLLAGCGMWRQGGGCRNGSACGRKAASSESLHVRLLGTAVPCFGSNAAPRAAARTRSEETGFRRSFVQPRDLPERGCVGGPDIHRDKTLCKCIARRGRHEAQQPGASHGAGAGVAHATIGVFLTRGAARICLGRHMAGMGGDQRRLQPMCCLRRRRRDNGKAQDNPNRYSTADHERKIGDRPRLAIVASVAGVWQGVARQVASVLQHRVSPRVAGRRLLRLDWRCPPPCRERAFRCPSLPCPATPARNAPGYGDKGRRCGAAFRDRRCALRGAFASGRRRLGCLYRREAAERADRRSPSRRGRISLRRNRSWGHHQRARSSRAASRITSWCRRLSRPGRSKITYP